jgi:hypothetical protein
MRNAMNSLPHVSLSSSPGSGQPDTTQKSPFIFAAGNGFPEVLLASQRNILSSSGLHTTSIGPGAQVESAKTLIDNLAPHLTHGANLLLHIHGQLGMNNEHALMLSESAESHVSTANFLEQLMKQAGKINAGRQQIRLPLPILQMFVTANGSYQCVGTGAITHARIIDLREVVKFLSEQIELFVHTRVDERNSSDRVPRSASSRSTRCSSLTYLTNVVVDVKGTFTAMAHVDFIRSTVLHPHKHEEPIGRRSNLADHLRQCNRPENFLNRSHGGFKPLFML